MILAGTALASCNNFFDTQVDLPTPEHEPRMAIAGLFTDNDTLLTVDVNRTYGLFESRPQNREQVIEGATVKILEDGNVRYELDYRETEILNVFAYDTPTNGTPFDAGKTYELVVEHPELPNIRATQVMPAAVELENAEIEFVGENAINFTNSRLRFDLNDPATRNYYELVISSVFRDTFIDETGQIFINEYEDIVYWYEEDLVSADARPGFRNSSLLFSDEAFNGQRRSFTLPFYSFSLEQDEGQSNGSTRIYWRTVTEDYYRYSSSLQDFSIADGNPFAEPVSVFSNIENGVGCFGLRAEKIYEF